MVYENWQHGSDKVSSSQDLDRDPVYVGKGQIVGQLSAEWVAMEEVVSREVLVGDCCPPVCALTNAGKREVDNNIESCNVVPNMSVNEKTNNVLIFMKICCPKVPMKVMVNLEKN